MTRKLSIFAILIFFFANTQAQNVKFGYIDSEKLMQELPETATAKATLEKETKDAEKHIATMQAEYQKLYQSYVENDQLAKESTEKWSSLIKTEKETEIQALMQRMQEFEKTASTSLQQKQAQLLQPIIDKVNKAIEEVGKEGKFTEIKDVTQMLYFSKEQFIDITPLVKKKLEITE